MYVTDGQMHGRTDGRTKATPIAPFPTGGWITISRHRPAWVHIENAIKVEDIDDTIPYDTI